MSPSTSDSSDDQQQRMIDTIHAQVQLSDVTVRFENVTALDNVSVQIAPGEQVGLIGPSGAGKTTLLRLLNRTVTPTTGHAELFGLQLANLTPRELRTMRTRVGFVPQDLRLIPNLRVIQNVISGRIGQQSLLQSTRSMLLPCRDETEAACGLLNSVGIDEKLYEHTNQLSGGQQQRVAIARALYQEPEILLADEPVASVDPARARDTIQLLTQVSQSEGLTLCVSLHNLELAREFFPRLIGLRDGRVIFDCATDELTEQQFNRLYDITPTGSAPRSLQ